MRRTVIVSTVSMMGGLAIVCGANRALASDDAGVLGFFRSMLGGDDAAPAAPDASSNTGSDEHQAGSGRAARRAALIVRLRFAPLPVKSAPVSIFEDTTLVAGDAVMTSQGIRIFAGSSSWPYEPTDFVALADAPQVSKEVKRIAAGLAELPHGGALPGVPSPASEPQTVGAL